MEAGLSSSVLRGSGLSFCNQQEAKRQEVMLQHYSDKVRLRTRRESVREESSPPAGILWPEFSEFWLLFLGHEKYLGPHPAEPPKRGGHLFREALDIQTLRAGLKMFRSSGFRGFWVWIQWQYGSCCRCWGDVCTPGQADAPPLLLYGSTGTLDHCSVGGSRALCRSVFSTFYCRELVLSHPCLPRP